MTFKKLALASAIAAVPAMGFSMTEVADQTLSDVTGQDGLTVTITPGAAGIAGNIYIHDKDGFGTGATAPLYGASYSWAGAITITGMSIGAGNTSGIVINIDAADNQTNAASKPILNVNIALPNPLTIVTGNIGVAHSGRTDTPKTFGISGNVNILNSMTITLGSTNLNIQLGNEVQAGAVTNAAWGTTDMVSINSTVANGVNITNFVLNDANSGGSFGATNIGVYDTGTTNTLSLKIGANINTAGLIIELGQVGTAAGGMDIQMQNVTLGTTTGKAIGDISMVGFNMNGSVIQITGH